MQDSRISKPSTVALENPPNLDDIYQERWGFPMANCFSLPESMSEKLWASTTRDVFHGFRSHPDMVFVGNSQKSTFFSKLETHEIQHSQKTHIAIHLKKKTLIFQNLSTLPLFLGRVFLTQDSSHAVHGKSLFFAPVSTATFFPAIGLSILTGKQNQRKASESKSTGEMNHDMDVSKN